MDGTSADFVLQQERMMDINTIQGKAKQNILNYLPYIL